jgi:hypothetical protein
MVADKHSTSKEQKPIVLQGDFTLLVPDQPLLVRSG